MRLEEKPTPCPAGAWPANVLALLTLGCSLLRMADCTLASGLLLAVGLAFATGYRSWTAAAGVWQTFWTGWFGAFPLAVTADAAGVALLLSLLSWETCNLYCAAKRKRKQKIR